MYLARCCGSGETEGVDMGHDIVSSSRFLFLRDGELIIPYPISGFHLI
jgi:hypothetical protein